MTNDITDMQKKYSFYYRKYAIFECRDVFRDVDHPRKIIPAPIGAQCFLMVIINITKRRLYEYRINCISAHYTHKGMVVGVVTKHMELVNISKGCWD